MAAQKGHFQFVRSYKDERRVVGGVRVMGSVSGGGVNTVKRMGERRRKWRRRWGAGTGNMKKSSVSWKRKTG